MEARRSYNAVLWSTSYLVMPNLPKTRLKIAVLDELKLGQHVSRFSMLRQFCVKIVPMQYPLKKGLKRCPRVYILPILCQSYPNLGS